MELGYACGFSSKRQSLDRQLVALTGAGVPTERIYRDKKTRTAAEQPGLTALLGYVRTGDTIVVHTVDLLGSDLSKVVDLVGDLATRGIQVRSLAVPDSLEEQLAFKIACQVLGSSVHLWDTNGRQNAVDAIMVHHPDGRVAAAECSSIGPEAEAEITGCLASKKFRLDIRGLTRVWYVQVPRDFKPAKLRLIKRALLRCEELGVDRPHRTRVQDPDIDALVREKVRAYAMPVEDGVTETPEARAYVVVSGVGGGEGIEPVVDELATELQTAVMQSKIKKLADTGIEERHLLLLVRPSAFTFSVYNELSYGGSLPRRSPRLPDGLSQVWLLSEWTDGSVVRAVASSGWHRDNPFGEPK